MVVSWEIGKGLASEFNQLSFRRGTKLLHIMCDKAVNKNYTREDMISFDGFELFELFDISQVWTVQSNRL